LIDSPIPKQSLVHVHPAPEELNRVYRAEVAIAAAPREFAAMLHQLDLEPEHDWQTWCSDARNEYLQHQNVPTIPGALQMGEIVEWLRDTLPADAIITNGAGNYATWAHRFLRWRQYGTQLAPTSGAMGYGVPAAVAAKLRHPQRTVVCFAGDGCFQMTGQELATAVQFGVNPIFLVINNGMLGTIRMHQERNYPSRISGTELTNPDFAALARAYGAHGVQIWRASNFPSAFLAALHASRPTLIELMIDPNAITPDQTLAQLDTKKPTN
jgi:acetolactate synthase-1/2/3 large subunit